MPENENIDNSLELRKKIADEFMSKSKHEPAIAIKGKGIINKLNKKD